MRPPLLGPSLTLAEIVYGTPVGKSDDLVEVHSEIVLAHGCNGSLRLIESHPREFSAIAREVHITIVIRLEISNHCKVAGEGIGLPVAIARKHGNGYLARVVISL